MNEQVALKYNGFSAFSVVIVVFVIAILCLGLEIGIMSFLGVVLIFGGIIAATGLCVVPPNRPMVLTYFGRYIGTIRESGFWWTIPLCMRRSVSVKVVNFNSEKLKVNDIVGNPIEIAAVVVYRVVDTAKAVFEVDNYLKFVEIQSETALRHVASKYAYDSYEDAGAISLRGSGDVVAKELQAELEQRLTVAGVEIIETRLTHLAYAMEIAGAMLQRQQASAVLAARQIIVEGAVGMAKMAITKLQQDGIVELDDERKMAMINNLMVAIVSEKSAQPVINTGSLY